jgi:hypothetical protein
MKMTNREQLKAQIDKLPDDVIELIQDYVSYHQYRLGIFDNDTDYLNSVPGMADIVIRGLNTPVSECFDSLE